MQKTLEVLAFWLPDNMGEKKFKFNLREVSGLKS